MIWRKTTLGDCIDFNNGYAFKSNLFTKNPNDIVLIKGENLGKGEILWDKSKYWSRENIEKLDKYFLKPDDILLAMDRPYVGNSLKYAIIKSDDPDSLLVQRVCRLRALKNKTTPLFLKSLISSPDFTNYIKNIMGGVGVPHISPSQIKSFNFLIPPLETQKRIASILSNYDDLIENNNKRIKLLEETAQNIYKEWFVNFRFPNYENTAFDKESGLPVGWEVVKLSETIEFKVDNRGRNPEYYSETGIPVIDNFLLKDSMAINLSNCKRYIDENIFNNFIRKYLEPNDVLITLVGNLGSISLTPQTKSVIIQNTIGLRSNNLISQYFLFCFLLLNKDKIQNMNRGVAQPSVLVGDLFNLEVLIPTKKHINSFSLKVESIFNMVSILGVQNQKLKEARDILLPRLMNRTIEV